MDQANGHAAFRGASTEHRGAPAHPTKPHRTLPPFRSVSFYTGSKLLFRKPLNNMGKPNIKLKLGTLGLTSSSTAPSPVVSTPIVTPGGHKLKFSIGGKASTPATPASEVVPKTVKTKAGRASIPSQKLIASKKRGKEESDNESDIITVNTAGRAEPKTKKIKFSISQVQTPKAPLNLKAKFRGKPPKRPLGEGYDSEASDREEDPTIEEEWILRMLPGEDCEYMRQMINERRIGLPRSQGGADIYFRFYHNDGRRAAVTIRGKHYAATMVDLPCVIEGMKSWDKKGWYKAADICQMLLVFAPIKNEADAETIELPKIVDPNTYQYPHGLTAPMRNARRARFRKRIRREAIEAVEEAVEALLAADAAATETRYEMIEPDLGSRTPGYFGDGDGYGSGHDESEGGVGYSANEDEDAEGEEDEGEYFGHQQQTSGLIDETMDDADADADADMERELEEAMMAEVEADLMEAVTPSSQAVADTPMVFNGDDDGQIAEDDSGDESVEDDDDDDAESEEDKDERAKDAQLQGAREDILEFEKMLANLQVSYAAQTNIILKGKIKANMDKIRAELQLKKSAIGEDDDD